MLPLLVTGTHVLLFYHHPINQSSRWFLFGLTGGSKNQAEVLEAELHSERQGPANSKLKEIP